MRLKSRWHLLVFTLLLGILLPGILFTALKTYSAGAIDPVTPAADTFVLLAWNDLGMHCYNKDFADLAVLPPFNNLWAQVILQGDPPVIVTSGITVTYVFTDNTYSAGKTNFWDYAHLLFGLSTPLTPNIGLTGKGLAGDMDLSGDHFVADGIPITEFSDSAPTVPDPYQLASIMVWDQVTLDLLAQARVVAPVSSEMRCDECHSDLGVATVESGMSPTGQVETNILTLHDQENMENYPPQYAGPLMDQRPVLCAKCHSSNALGEPGIAGIPNLSNAMHGKHSEEGEDFPPGTAGCYKCHPGPTTECLRDVMSQEYGFTCENCHGTLAEVALNPDPWLNEPLCDSCHGGEYLQNNPLYRNSTAHGGIYCEACHDSTHAIAESREPRDAMKFVDLQGYAGTLDLCTVCHLTQPTGEFQHILGLTLYRNYLPGMIKNK